MKAGDDPRWTAAEAEARKQWPGLPPGAFDLARGLPIPIPVENLTPHIVAMLARASMLMHDSQKSAELMYTGSEHVAYAITLLMDSGAARNDALEADLDRFRRTTDTAAKA